VRIILESLSLDEITKADEENGNTSLIWAAEIGNVELTSLLLETVVSKSKKSREENEEEDTTLIVSFANHRGYLGATALNRAARRGHTDVLKLLLTDEEKTNGFLGQGFDFNPDLPNHKLQHPLHFAAFKKKPEALKYLLQCGANPWVVDRKGRRPVEDTSCERCKSILKEAMQ